MNRPITDKTKLAPFEARELRDALKDFFEEEFPAGAEKRIGDYRWGIYAFYDYDGEPIYVGQTNEKVRTRISRHLTNQRTDAVAMSVLDPMEVKDVEVWPLPDHLQGNDSKHAETKQYLDALEAAIYAQLVEASEFKAVLNEKNPPVSKISGVIIPKSLRKTVISDDVLTLRSHPDVRIARRALIISRLAQVISERKVQGGLRRALLTQAKRLQWLSDRRFQATGGQASVATRTDAKKSDESEA